MRHTISLLWFFSSSAFKTKAYEKSLGVSEKSKLLRLRACGVTAQHLCPIKRNRYINS